MSEITARLVELEGQLRTMKAEYDDVLSEYMQLALYEAEGYKFLPDTLPDNVVPMRGKTND